MRPHEIFAAMPPEHAEAFFATLAEQCPALFTQAVHAAALAMKSRPQYLFRQPPEKRGAAVRRALARVASGPMAEEVLATYFLECRKEVLTDWLDRVGLEHEEGLLKADAPDSPSQGALDQALKDYRAAAGDDDRDDRELLLRAFAAQASIDWSLLDAQLSE